MARKHRDRSTGKSPPSHAGPAPKAGHAHPHKPRRWTLLAALIVVAAGAAAYSNSLAGPFIYDGVESITENPSLRRLWPISEAMKAPPQATTSGRPLVCLSLAVNYAVSGLDVWSYHAFNLAVHLAAGLALLGVVRRTCLSLPAWDKQAGPAGGREPLGRGLQEAFARRTTLLAGICALLWVVHPLNTQAVTYVIQRAESMTGLFYLLTMYCAVRGFASPRPAAWFVLAFVACSVGMTTKEVMATAPLMVLIYDRVFVARSWKEMLRRRWGFYLSLAATWAILAALVSGAPRSESAGFGLVTFTPIEYARTQCKVVLHYARLALWPSPLVLDYARNKANSLADYAPQGAVILAALAVTAAAFRFAPAAAFLGAWFFLVLAPSSSFVPIADPAFEHRMYLSLAAVVAGVVFGGYALVCKAGSTRRPDGTHTTSRSAGIVALALVAAAAVALAAATHRRNEDYRDDVTIWRDTVDKQPDNFRAWATLAAGYANRGMTEQAIAASSRAIELYPGMSYAYNARAVAYERRGDLEAAIADFSRTIQVDPSHSRAYMNRGELYRRTGRIDQAIADCDESIKLNPRYESTFLVRGLCWVAKGANDKAIADFTEAIRLEPGYLQAYGSRADAYSAAGQPDKAVSDFQHVLSANPSDARAAKALQDLQARKQGG